MRLAVSRIELLVSRR